MDFLLFSFLTVGIPSSYKYYIESFIELLT